MKIIGLIGAKGSGKTTAAKRLQACHGFWRYSFAGPLKEMLAALGVSHRQLYGDLRETPSELLCGKTPRWAMQTLGTEWRDLIGTELWTNIMRKRLMDTGCADDVKIVIDDVRFDHEVRLIREFEGSIWRIRRPEIEPTEQSCVHASEIGWRTLKFDTDIFNTNSVAKLHTVLDCLILPE